MQTRRVCKFFSLLLSEGSACGLLTVTGSAALDVDVICMTLIVIIIHTFCSFAIDADRFARMLQRADIASGLFLCKALAAGVLTALCMLASHHDVSLAAALLCVVAAVVHSAF